MSRKPPTPAMATVPANELVVLRRLAETAARFRVAEIAVKIKAFDRAAFEFRRWACDLDYDLRMLAEVRGQPAPWPPPPMPTVGAAVTFVVDGKTHAGYIEAIDGDGVATCLGVSCLGEIGPRLERWSAPARSLRVVVP